MINTKGIKSSIRSVVRVVAVALDRLTQHAVTPNAVTLVGVVAHIFIALAIAFNYLLLAAVLLTIFGLFDTLDGELARVQNRASTQGMLLDASTDRFKETLLYTGCAYLLSFGHLPQLSVLAVVACGASICVSYVKAKGEAAIAASRRSLSHAELNRLFADGLASFEVRMVFLIAGLALNQLVIALALIATLATITALQRLYRISRELRRVQN